MTVLAAAQSAAIRLLGRKPASLFGSDTFGLELGELATEAAVDIAEYHDWQKLKILQTHAGDGSTLAFDLPADYGRMLKKGDVHSSMWKAARFRRVRDEDEWIYLQSIGFSGTPGAWIILGGQMQIYPPMPVGETARYYYISSNLVGGNDFVDDNGNTLVDDRGNTLSTSAIKAAFTDDQDVFLLNERLLTLSLIWRWRSQKRMEYSEDLTNYEVALDKAAATDKGSRILTVGRHRVATGAAMAFPGVIVT